MVDGFRVEKKTLSGAWALNLDSFLLYKKKCNTEFFEKKLVLFATSE